METVTLFDAQAHLAELVDRAAAGDDVCITRQGKPVARIVSVASDRKAIDVAALREMILAMPMPTNSADDSLRRMRDEERY